MHISEQVHEILEEESPASPGLASQPNSSSASSTASTNRGHREEDSQNAAKLTELAMRAREIIHSTKTVVQRPSLPGSLKLCTDVLEDMQSRLLELEGESQVRCCCACAGHFVLTFCTSPANVCCRN